jgi:hypothetical protein
MVKVASFSEILIVAQPIGKTKSVVSGQKPIVSRKTVELRTARLSDATSSALGATGYRLLATQKLKRPGYLLRRGG